MLIPSPSVGLPATTPSPRGVGLLTYNYPVHEVYCVVFETLFDSAWYGAAYDVWASAQTQCGLGRHEICLGCCFSRALGASLPHTPLE